MGELEERLAWFAVEHYGQAAKVQGLERKPGHSGLSFSFNVVSVITGATLDELVIRLAPKGAPPTGNNDLVRQARLMKAVQGHGVPVPPLRWFGAGPPWFDSSFHITERVPGQVFQDWDPDPEFASKEIAPERLYLRAADVLAQLHHVPVERLPLAGEPAKTPRDEVVHWWRVATKAGPEKGDQVRLGQVRDQLLETAPRAIPGLVHGDFRGGNLLFDGEKLNGVLDWEVAGLGPRLLDLGWLLLFLDAKRWYGNGPSNAGEIAALVIERYREQTVEELGCLGWYQALARYRWVSIILFNSMLHSRGKRIDAFFEHASEAKSVLLDDAAAALAEGDLA